MIFIFTYCRDRFLCSFHLFHLVLKNCGRNSLHTGAYKSTADKTNYEYRNVLLYFYLFKCSVSIVSRLQAGRPGYQFLAEAEIFSLRHPSQTGSGVHPASSAMDTDCFSSVGKVVRA